MVEAASDIDDLFDGEHVVARRVEAADELVASLHPDEAIGTETMGPGRLAEFASARAAAREALGELGIAAAVRRGARGEPLWPVDVTGSISHTRGHCLAVVAHHAVQDGRRLRVGLDMETIERVNPAIARRILTAGEQAELEQLGISERQLRVATVFATKEAFYKAHQQIDPRFLGFDAIAVEVLDTGELGFTEADGVADGLDLRRDVRARWTIQDGRVVVGLAIRSELDLHPDDDG
ncbi:MAG: 4'-phosphopantetheinyl transferase superfamily protein [Actinomycetota bacterium]